MQVAENMRDGKLMQTGEFTLLQIQPDEMRHGAGAVQFVESLKAEMFLSVTTR
jgi:hypothetical protein